ncbi:hypothetical protein [Flaviflexus ciconiae]|uniref:hypothetical protein n=1 Tax=Flaviflexus ciconiae TaxID=2496867 RepID=UPI0013E0E63A|nr:hypothetical protein [Flaviflexus ciconiae]
MTERHVTSHPWEPGRIALYQGDPFGEDRILLAIITTSEAVKLIKSLADSIEGTSSWLK